MVKSLALTAALATAALGCLTTDAHPTTVWEPMSFLPMHVGGRVTTYNTYQWPGVYFEARFHGPSVTLVFDDDANNFNVIVDGRQVMLLRKPGKAEIRIGDYDGGDHTIRVEKRSETQYATGRFVGFIDNVPPGHDPTPLPPPQRARQIEFIGDSYTVGYGNTSAFTQCTPEDIFETTDAQEGFPALVGKHYDADYQVEAFSGLGMVRNYDGHEHPKYRMPMLYPRVLFDDPTPAVQPDWHPQIIVIGIGGNDFSTPLHDDEPWKTRGALVADYHDTFVKFVQDVRAHNPNAFILIDAPPAERAEYNAAVTAVFNTLKASGDRKIDELTLPATDNTGCNGHPNIQDDAKVAGALQAYFDAHPEVWQGK